MTPSQMEILTNREIDCLTAYAACGNRQEAADMVGIGKQHFANTIGSCLRKLGVDEILSAFRVIGWLAGPSVREAAEINAQGRIRGLRNRLLTLRDEVDVVIEQLHAGVEEAETAEGWKLTGPT